MTKPREKTREELQAEIEGGKKKIRQFENREKMLRQKLFKEERRTRSHRFIVRGAVFESIVPEAKGMTNEESATFLRLALTMCFRETKRYVKKLSVTFTKKICSIFMKLRITFTHSCSLKHKKQRNIKSLCSRRSKCNRKKSLATFRS